MAPPALRRLAPFVFAIATHAACTAPGGGGGASVDCNQFPHAPVCGGGGTTPGGSADTRTSEDASTEGACGAGGLSLDGSLGVASGIAFDTVSVTLEHKMDVDAFEDGCLTAIRIELGKGLGCKLVVEAGDAIANDGGLRVTRIAFSADSQCPGFPDDREGLYDDTREMDLMLVVPDDEKVPNQNAPSACLVTNLALRLGGALRDEAGRSLAVAPSVLMISGELASRGSTTASCPCAPACSGKDCGGDGCGFECGRCDASERCDREVGACLCVPDCSGRVCGDDGCGGSCGGCQGTDHCEGGQCAACEPDCDGKVCGNDGCGGTCGSGCQAGRACSGGQCLCAPKCDGKQCGDDGCGGQCGACDAGEECLASLCWCAPQCANKDCGDDGCGGDCGSCSLGGTCRASGVCETTGFCNGTCEALDQALCPSDCGGCGDGTCGGSETHASCAADCAVGCGDGQCKPGESMLTCPADCTLCGDGVCAGLELSTCLSDCIPF